MNRDVIVAAVEMAIVEVLSDLNVAQTTVASLLHGVHEADNADRQIGLRVATIIESGFDARAWLTERER
jgi:hypothetical protein